MLCCSGEREIEIEGGGYREIEREIEIRCYSMLYIRERGGGG